MRFHVVGLPHTRTSKEFCACAYTQKVLNFCKMMRSLGHEVFHYGAEGSEVDVTEHVTVVTRDDQKLWFGDHDWKSRNFNVKWNHNELYWQCMNTRAATEILKRAQERDFICLIGGWCQKPISDLLPSDLKVTVVEHGVGYYGCFSKYRVFESYTHQAAYYGTQSKDPNVNLFDVVIPNYFDPSDFDPKLLRQQRKNYLLFVGRIIPRKGITTAVDIARLTGRKLKVAGQGVVGDDSKNWVTEDGLLLPKDIVDYVGYADVKTRAKLMAHAHALVAPTTYLEPFGGVAVEAQFCGTPVISTDYGGFVDTVRHGYTGFRCHTLSQFVQAVNRTGDLLKPQQIRDRAVKLYSLSTIQKMYHEYFTMLTTLWEEGWYKQDDREQLDWLTRT